MPDPVPAPTPIIKPGNQTSEYKATKMVVILSILATVVGLVQQYVPGFIEGATEGSSAHKWGGMVLAVAGIIGSVLAILGYGGGRVALKKPGMEITKQALAHQTAVKEKEAADAKTNLIREMRNSKPAPGEGG